MGAGICYLNKTIRKYLTTLTSTSGKEKQMRLIVALLKSIGLIDSDLKGSIQQLRAKANNKVEGLPLPDDDKTRIDWLRKGGIER